MLVECLNTFQCWEAETSKKWFFVSINNQQVTNFSKVRNRETNSSLQVFKHQIPMKPVREFIPVLWSPLTRCLSLSCSLYPSSLANCFQWCHLRIFERKLVLVIGNKSKPNFSPVQRTICPLQEVRNWKFICLPTASIRRNNKGLAQSSSYLFNNLFVSC